MPGYGSQPGERAIRRSVVCMLVLANADLQGVCLAHVVFGMFGCQCVVLAMCALVDFAFGLFVLAYVDDQQ